MQGLAAGTVVGGRYTVGHALSENGDAQAWTASDSVLDRPVTLVTVADESSQALAVLDAAHRAAGIDSHRLVRILDVGQEPGFIFFVEESLTGATPLTTLARDGLAGEEVRRLTGEVALALDAGQRRGLHHLGLTPDNVLRLSDGSVKLAGLATQAALAGQDHVGGERALRRDARGLVALAYSGLTGRWPVAGDVGLEPAPRMVGGVPRPSEIAVGVPADLDTICQLTLNEDRGPISPGDYAAQIAPWADMSVAQVALEPTRPRTVGPEVALPVVPGSGMPASDGAGVTAPITTTPARAGGRTSPDGTPARDGGGASGVGTAGGAVAGAVGAAAAGATGAAAAGAAATGAAVGSAAAGAAGTAGAAGGAAVGAAGAAGAAAAFGAVTAGASRLGSAAMRRVRSAGKVAKSASERPKEAVADHRALREAMAADDVAHRARLDQTPNEPVLEAPAPLLPPEAGAPPSRAQSRMVLLLFAGLTAVALLLGIVGATRTPKSDLESLLGPDPTAKVSTSSSAPPSTTSSTAGALTPVAIVGATGYDPEGDNAENNDLAPRVYDENDATSWQSEGYQSPNFGGLKSGVGVLVDLGESVKPREIVLQLPNPSDLELYLSDDPDRAGANQIGKVTAKSGKVTVKVTGTSSGRYLIVWFTDSPRVADGRYRATLAEVTVLA